MSYDVWNEKPDAELVDGISGIVAYEAVYMDDWLEKIRPLVYAGEQAVKWGYVEIHDTDPVTYTVHCGLKEETKNLGFRNQEWNLEPLLLDRPTLPTEGYNNLHPKWTRLICKVLGHRWCGVPIPNWPRDLCGRCGKFRSSKEV